MYSISNIKKGYIRILVVSISVLIILIPLYFYIISTNIVNIANQRLNMVEIEISNKIKSNIKFLSTISSTSTLENLKQMALSLSFKNIVLVDSKGIVVQSLYDRYVQGIDISNENIFKKCKFYKKPLVEYIVQSMLNPDPAILIIIPINNGYVVGVVSDITNSNQKAYYVLADSYGNINSTNFNYFSLVGNVGKYFGTRKSGVTFIKNGLYYFSRIKIMDNLYLYTIEKINNTLLIISVLFITGTLLSLYYLKKFLDKNIKILSGIFNFVETFSDIFSELTSAVKNNEANFIDKIFIYNEQMAKFKVNIIELSKIKNSFGDFFKIIIEEIDEITSRDEEISTMNQDLESMYADLENYSNQFSLVIEMISKIDSELTVEEFLSKMHSGFTEIFEVETLVIFKINNKTYKIGSIVELSDNIIKIPLTVINKKEEQIIGNIFISPNRTSNSSENKTYNMFAKILSIFLTHKIRSQQIEELYLNSIKALANAVEIKDKYTRGHSERVAKISIELAKHIGLDKENIDILYQAAILHDIGKIGIPDRVLNKAGKLTDDEYNLIKEHPYLGYKIISEIRGMEYIATIIKYHHERFDGKGYPDGLSGNEIPYISRLISIVDAYDAMHSDRSYRKSLPLDKIKDIFLQEKGKQWDPDLTDKFLEIIDQINDSL